MEMLAESEKSLVFLDVAAIGPDEAALVGDDTVIFPRRSRLRDGQDLERRFPDGAGQFGYYVLNVSGLHNNDVRIVFFVLILAQGFY